MTTPVRGRFAPSPSGEMHLGNAWTALLAWLQVRNAQGIFVLRIEDLDPDRSRREYVELIKKDLNWLGLDWDEGPDIGGPYLPYTQSERTRFYEQALDKLLYQDLVYPCFCSRADIRSAVSAPHDTQTVLEYPGTCRHLTIEEIETRKALKKNFSWRFRTPDREVRFKDLSYGEQVYNPFREFGDFIIRRSDNAYAYQLAVVVDDALMNISHVLRGVDLLPSTARQILLYQALNHPLPQFTHVPLLYGPDDERLSKRHGAVSINSLRQRGVKSSEIIGLLGYWANLLPRPIPVQAQDLIPLFDLRKIPQEKIIVDPAHLF